jgi:hypothetical protein
MKQELDDQLCREFPNLYADRYASMQQTCMCWGFEISDGWFSIIYNLSAKLEKLIVEYKEKHKDDMRCMFCTRKESEHTKFYTFTEDGNTTIPIHDIVAFSSANPVSPEKVFECNNFSASFPRASQVKEKYGGLRFYMTSFTDEMDALINEAESQCYSLCEDCGKTGELCTDGGWYRTLCEDCVDKYNKGIDTGYGIRVRSYVQCSKLKEINNGNEEKEEEVKQDSDQESSSEEGKT